MKIDVIFPCRNQGHKLVKNLREQVIPFFDNEGITYDILVVSDHSKPEEEEYLKQELASFPPQVKLYLNDLGPGKGGAVQKGFKEADGDYVLFMDCDLATDLKTFDLIKPILGQYGAYIGSRDIEGAKIKEMVPLRRFLHKASKSIILGMFHLNKLIHDSQCGYKLFPTPLAKKMAERQIISAFAFDVEYLYFCTLNGYSIKEIPVHWENDTDSAVKAFSASTKFYGDLFKIKRHKKSYILTPEEKKELDASLARSPRLEKEKKKENAESEAHNAD